MRFGKESLFGNVVRDDMQRQTMTRYQATNKDSLIPNSTIAITVDNRGTDKRVAKGLCVTRDKGSNLYVTRESYLKRNVIREYLNACDA